MPRRTASLLVALAALALAALTWLVFVTTFAGQRLDAAAYGGAGWARFGMWPVVDAARVLVLPLAGVGVVGAVGWLWVRGLRWRALVVLGVCLGSQVSIQLLKHELLPRPGMGFTPDPNSLPSGHAGAVAVACASLVLAAPPARRAVVAYAGSWLTAVVGYASVVAHQHRPSDIVAAVLVVLAWVAAGAAVLAGGRTRPRRRAAVGREPADELAPTGRLHRAVLRVLAVQAAAFAVPAVASIAVVGLATGRPVGGLETLIALLGGLAAITSASSFLFMAAVLVAPPEGAVLRRAATTRAPRARSASLG